ncbi:hypothetical protein TRFO_16871 [Tritrichomonas foetus]|uniref:Uncharacterized protein n=1 Tax=Tritrichomonas foetus TaxID=1144522 RepID=A0A1J4KPF1_9EUKA|nr:hypothetical protein TRFO_16871 [Tritrichomonas foetus]|eukprot:OHT13115.1 hypothetical protein TRFO_16871 [Tritrichomonas foetus]
MENANKFPIIDILITTLIANLKDDEQTEYENQYKKLTKLVKGEETTVNKKFTNFFIHLLLASCEEISPILINSFNNVLKYYLNPQSNPAMKAEIQYFEQKLRNFEKLKYDMETVYIKAINDHIKLSDDVARLEGLYQHLIEESQSIYNKSGIPGDLQPKSIDSDSYLQEQIKSRTKHIDKAERAHNQVIHDMIYLIDDMNRRISKYNSSVKDQSKDPKT